MNAKRLSKWRMLAPALLATLVVVPHETAQACMKPSPTRPGRLYNSCVVDFPSFSPEPVVGSYGTTLRPLPPPSPFSSGQFARTGSIQLGQ